MEKRCMECGNLMHDSGSNFICKKCRRKIYDALHEEGVVSDQTKPEEDDYAPIFPIDNYDSNIYEDVREAERLGMSYGYYMASKRVKK